MLCLWILSEPSVPTQTHHPEESLTKYATAHLAYTLATVYKYHWYFLYLVAHLVGCILHLYLECVTLETNLIEWYRFKNTTAITLKTSSCIVYIEACYKAYILRSKIAHKHTTNRPVHNIHTTYITRANCHVVTFIMTSRI